MRNPSAPSSVRRTARCRGLRAIQPDDVSAVSSSLPSRPARWWRCSVPADRSGLASGLNYTTRQAGTALEVAVFGSVAGTANRANEFVAGLHDLAIVGALLWLTALVLTVTAGVSLEDLRVATLAAMPAAD